MSTTDDMEIKTKYNIDDCVWAMVENHPTCFRITGITANFYKSTFTDEIYTNVYYRGLTLPDIVHEKNCYDSKEELLNSFR